MLETCVSSSIKKLIWEFNKIEINSEGIFTFTNCFEDIEYKKQVHQKLRPVYFTC